MMEPAEIKKAIERSKKAVELKPALGESKSTTVAKMVGGLACEVSNGSWKYTVDMPPAVGGDESAPDPGVYGRGALGSCLAIGYTMWFALLEVPCQGVEVDVITEMNDGGLLAVSDDLLPGYTDIRVKARIISDAPRADVEKAMEAAEKHSPWLYNFTQPFKVERELEIATTAKPSPVTS